MLRHSEMVFVPLCVLSAPRIPFMEWANENDVAFKQARGSYKGKVEDSFVCYAADLTDIKAAGLLAGQESVLLLGPRYRDGKLYGNREASLLDLASGDETPLGHYQAVSEKEAKALPGWTLDLHTGQYFAVLPDNASERRAA